MSYVVISHCHADHWCGNQVFESDVPILTTHATREQMPPSDRLGARAPTDPSRWSRKSKKCGSDLEIETDQRWRASHLANLYPHGPPVGRHAHLELRFPNQTFESGLVFYGASRTVELHVCRPPPHR